MCDVFKRAVVEPRRWAGDLRHSNVSITRYFYHHNNFNFHYHHYFTSNSYVLNARFHLRHKHDATGRNKLLSTKKYQYVTFTPGNISFVYFIPRCLNTIMLNCRNCVSLCSVVISFVKLFYGIATDKTWAAHCANERPHWPTPSF